MNRVNHHHIHPLHPFYCFWHNLSHSVSYCFHFPHNECIMELIRMTKTQRTPIDEDDGEWSERWWRWYDVVCYGCDWWKYTSRWWKEMIEELWGNMKMICGSVLWNTIFEEWICWFYVHSVGVDRWMSDLWNDNHLIQKCDGWSGFLQPCILHHHQFINDCDVVLMNE